MNRYLMYSFLLLSIYSCGKSNRHTDMIIDKFNSPDKNIDNFNYLYQLATKCPKCLDTLNLEGVLKKNGEINRFALQKHYFNEVIDTSEVDIKAQMFLENSASMWGYFNGQTDAERVLARMLLHSDLLFGDQGTEFSFITDSIYKQTKNVEWEEYLQRLEPINMKRGNYKDSKIADIIKRVINNTESNEMSILISDCIYSLNNDSSIEGVASEWALIEAAFSRLLQKADFSVFIIKYKSQFNGIYYSLNKNGGESKNSVGLPKGPFYRPYYAIVIGETKLLKTAMEKVDFKGYYGYQNSYFITQPRSAERIDYRIINSNKIGKFRLDKKNIKHSIVDAQKSKRGPTKGVFQYTIAANLNEMGVESDYLNDNDKYVVTGDYEVAIKEISEEDRRLDPALSTYSHYIHLKTFTSLKEEEVLISLKRETPNWIITSHTDMDSNLTAEFQNKTRGFKNLVEGIENAFDFAYKSKKQNEAKYYFTLTTKVNL